MCSAAAYESEDALGRDESQPDALRRFFFLLFFTETFITEYKMAPDALLAAEENGRRTKQTREVKGITSLSVDSLAFRSVKSSRPQTLT